MTASPELCAVSACPSVVKARSDIPVNNAILQHCAMKAALFPFIALLRVTNYAPGMSCPGYDYQQQRSILSRWKQLQRCKVIGCIRLQGISMQPGRRPHVEGGLGQWAGAAAAAGGRWGCWGGRRREGVDRRHGLRWTGGQHHWGDRARVVVRVICAAAHNTSQS